MAGLAPEAVRPELGLMELGLDSMMIVELSKQLAAALGVAVDSSEVIEEPSIAGLVEMLAALVERQVGGRPIHAAPSLATGRPGRRPAWSI